MGKLRHWRGIINRAIVCYRYYLCEIGDWAGDYGKGSGNDLVVEANSAFAAILASTEAVAKIRVVPYQR